MSNRERYRQHEIRVRGSLEHLAPSNPDNDRFRQYARELWTRFGILMVWPDQHVGGWPERAMLDNIGIRLYGEKAR